MQGTLSGGICFATQAAAARNECSVTARFFSGGAYSCQAVLGTPSESDGGSYLMSYSQRYQSSATAFSISTVSTQLQVCQLEDYWPMALPVSSGLLIAGAVGTVWLIAWASRAVRSTLSGGEGE